MLRKQKPVFYSLAAAVFCAVLPGPANIEKWDASTSTWVNYNGTANFKIDANDFGEGAGGGQEWFSWTSNGVLYRVIKSSVAGTQEPPASHKGKRRVMDEAVAKNRRVRLNATGGKLGNVNSFEVCRKIQSRHR